MNSKLKGFSWIFSAILLSGVLALGLPFFVKRIPWSVEKKISFWVGGLPDAILCEGQRNPESLVSFQKIIQRLFPINEEDKTFPITVEVVSGDTVNAFATFGGHIYVYDGLIKKAGSAEEVAGVLAHEIEHVKRRHVLQGVFVRLITVEAFKFGFSGGGQMGPELAHLLLNMKFTREQEKEADQGGLQRLQLAHIDVLGYQHFFERFVGETSLPAILSDHPSSYSRAQLVKKYLGSPTQPILDSRGWALVKKICE